MIIRSLFTALSLAAMAGAAHAQDVAAGEKSFGLGLSISHAIVEGHGGTIRAESNSWGGATFHVFLPLVRQGAA